MTRDDGAATAGSPPEPVVEVLNRTRFKVREAAVVELVRSVLRAEGAADGELGVRFVGERHMRALNREFLGDDSVTDVLAFPLEDIASGVGGPPEAPDAPRLLGDVVVCLARAQRQAAAARLPFSLEVGLLLVHGTLHVLGYDHEEDGGAMAARQTALLGRTRWEGLVAAPH